MEYIELGERTISTNATPEMPLEAPQDNTPETGQQSPQAAPLPEVHSQPPVNQPGYWVPGPQGAYPPGPVGQPQYPAQGQPVYYQQPAQGPYAQQGYYQQPQQYQYPVQQYGQPQPVQYPHYQVSQPYPSEQSAPRPKPAFWGIRLAAGIVGIVLGLWTPLAAILVSEGSTMPGMDQAALLLILAGGIGALVTSTIIVAANLAPSMRGTVTLLAFAATALVGNSLGGLDALPPGHMLSLAVIVLACLALQTSRNGAMATAGVRAIFKTVAGGAAITSSIFALYNFAFSVRIEDGLDFSLPINLLAGPALLAAGVLLMAGARKGAILVLAAAGLSLLGSIATLITFPPSGIAVLLPPVVVAALAIAVVVWERKSDQAAGPAAAAAE